MARPRPEPGAASSARTPRCSTASRIDVSSPGPSSSTVMTTVGAVRARRRWRSATEPTCRRCRAGCRASRRDLRARCGPCAPGRPRPRWSSPRSACSRSSVRASPSAEAEHRAVRARRRARRRRARVREVIVHLPPHALDLLMHRPPRARACPACVGDLRFVRKHRERRLQRVREIAGLGDRAPDGLIAMLEQRVEIVDERLHLARIAPLDAAIAPLVHRGEALAQLGERRQAVPHHRQPAQQADRRKDDRARSCARSRRGVDTGG